MRYGKTIELFMVNGIPDNLVIAELSNQIGKATGDEEELNDRLV